MLLYGSMLFGVSGFAYSPDAFVIVVKTDNNGTSADYQFTIPTNPSYTYDYNVDCTNDDIIDAYHQTGDYICNLDTDHKSNPRAIIITGTFPAFYLNNEKDKEKLLEVHQWGTRQWKSMRNAFYGASNLYYIPASTSPDLSQVTDMSHMFDGCSTLNAGAVGISDWNISTVRYMYNMFASATTFNQNIGQWNTSSLYSAVGMFSGASNFNQDIGDWNVSNVMNMSAMFNNATSFNQDIDDWNVSNVVNMSSMFRYAESFNQDIGDWDCSNVSNISSIFYSASSFNQDISNWNFSSIVAPSNLGLMFPAVHLSISNYDSLLNSLWKQNPVDGVSFHVGASDYCRGTGAHDNLEIRDAWTFTDGNENCSFHITSSYTMSVKDGATMVGTVTSTYGAEDTWFQISGGADKDKFNINDNGDLTFKIAPDVNNPTDRNKDNIYRVQVYAYDDMGAVEDYQTIKVTVEPKSNGTLVPIISYLLF